VKRSWKWWLFVPLAVVAAAIVTLIALQERQPHYGGKSLSQWLQAYIQSRDGSADERQCEAAVRHIGNDAIPYLLARLEKRPAWKTSLVKLSRRFPRRLKGSSWFIDATRDARRPEEALVGFSILGRDNDHVLPKLVAAMQNRKNDQTLVILAIGFCGKPAVPILVNTLTNKANDTNVRANAASALGEMGVDAMDAVPVLINCLEEPQPISTLAMDSLGALGLEPELCVAALADKLQEPDPEKRKQALFGLSQFHTHARSVLPSIENLLTDKDLGVRMAATNVLKTLINTNGVAGPGN
jgi:HEAT repeat protein